MTNDQSPSPSGNSLRSPGKSSSQLRPESPEAPKSSGPPPVPVAKTRRWIALSGVVVPTAIVALFLTLWFIRRDPIPRDVPVATAWEGSSYHVFGAQFRQILDRQFLFQRARVVLTSGSRKNVQTLQNKEVQLAMYQGGTIPLGDAAIVAPLYHEVVHVLIKKRIFEDSKYEGREPTGDLLRDLLIEDGRELYAGGKMSGMRYLGELQLAFEGEKTDCHSDRRPIISASHPKHQSDAALFVAMGVLGKRALRGTDYAYLGKCSRMH